MFSSEPRRDPLRSLVGMAAPVFTKKMVVYCSPSESHPLPHGGNAVQKVFRALFMYLNSLRYEVDWEPARPPDSIIDQGIEAASAYIKEEIKKPGSDTDVWR